MTNFDIAIHAIIKRYEEEHDDYPRMEIICHESDCPNCVIRSDCTGKSNFELEEWLKKEVDNVK